MRKLLGSLPVMLLPAVLFAGPVDLNSADAATIARELNGVGSARAEAIVEYRRKYGEFETAEDLLNVTGIGKHILESNRENIKLSEASGD